MLKSIACVGAFLVMSALRADAASVAEATFGCLKDQDFARIGKQVHGGNVKDGMELLKALVLSGDCRFFDEGEGVVVEKTTELDTFNCITPYGGTECYWTLARIAK